MYKLLIITSISNYIQGGVTVTQTIESFETESQAIVAQKQIKLLQDILEQKAEIIAIKTVLLF